MPPLPEFEAGIALVNCLSSTDSTIVAHFWETTRAITTLTKNLNYLGCPQEDTSLLVRCRELHPLLGQTGLPSGVDAFSNYTLEVDVKSSPEDCFDGGADLVKHYFATGDLRPG